MNTHKKKQANTLLTLSATCQRDAQQSVS